MALDGGLWGWLWRGAEDGDDPRREPRPRASGRPGLGGRQRAGAAGRARIVGCSRLATALSTILQTAIERLLLARAWSWGWVETLPPVLGEGGRENTQVAPGQGLAA